MRNKPTGRLTGLTVFQPRCPAGKLPRICGHRRRARSAILLYQAERLPSRLTLRWPPVQREPTFFSAWEPLPHRQRRHHALRAKWRDAERQWCAIKIVLTRSGQIQFGIVWNDASCAWTSGYSQGATSPTMNSCSGPALVSGEIISLTQVIQASAVLRVRERHQIMVVFTFAAQ